MTSRKQELLDRLTAYLLKHGVAGLSLRPMAAEIGTSARLLIFHFGSKERLLAEVLDEMQARLRRSFKQLTSGDSHGSRGPLLKVFWTWATSAENQPYFCLLYQLQVLEAQDPGTYASSLQRNSLNWLELIQPALPASQRTPAFATLYQAVFDGLFLELMSTADRRRTTRALDEFIGLARFAATGLAPGRTIRRKP